MFAREGYAVVSPFFVLGVAALIWGRMGGGMWAYVAGGILLFVGVMILLFFRDPERSIPQGDGLVLAPADGKVITTERLEDGRLRIAIFLSIFDVHVNRVPVTSTVTDVTSRPGTYFNAASDDAATKNARIDVAAKRAEGPLFWCQVSGLVARKISCRLQAGQTVKAGARYGLIYFGSRMEVLLPETAQLRTSVGARAVAGETMIAEFAREETA